MRTSNIYGLAYHFIPKDIPLRDTQAEVAAGLDKVTQGNVVYIMTGTMPPSSDLYEINDTTEFETLYTNNIATKFENIEMTYSYHKRSKERIIKKTPVDALDFTMNVSGPITWFAIKLTDWDGDREDGEQTFIFSDSIGLWDDLERAMIVESMAASVGDANIFKDFVLSIQDGLKSELV